MGRPLITTNDIAKRFGLHTWTVRRLFDDGVLPEPMRAGPYRVVPESALPAIEAILRDRGLLKVEAQVA